MSARATPGLSAPRKLTEALDITRVPGDALFEIGHALTGLLLSTRNELGLG